MTDFINNSNIKTEDIIKGLQTVFDPDIHYSIYDMGLIYNIEVNNNIITITMTLTSVDCPEAQSIPQDVKNTLSKLFIDYSINVEVVFEPAWTVDNMTDEIKLGLGLL